MNRRYGLFIFFCITFFLSSFSASAQKELKEANALYQKFEYALAVESYKKALEKQEPTLDISQKIAHCYRLINKYKEAEFWYAQVLAFPDHDPVNIKHYADAARKNGNYTKAKQLYLDYAQKVPAEAAQARQLAQTTENALQWMAAPEPFELEKQTALNSANADFSPVYYQEGLVYTSERGGNGKEGVSGWTGRPYPKLVYSKGKAGNWSAPELLPEPINSKHQNGSAVFSQDGNTIYFTRINQVKQKRKKANTDPFSWVKFSENSDYINRLEIFIAEKKGEKWSDPKPFPFNKVSEYSIGHPALSPDGTVLYFASDMPGGLGETDIFYSEKQADGTWGKPVNAGGQINTPGKELFPVVTAKGTLYFSSEGQAGMGGLDIFMAEGAKETWKNIRNLKFPLNSPQDDFGILLDSTGEGGFLSSNRGNEDGTDDIFTFKYLRIPCNLAGKTIERVQTKPGVFKDVPVEKVMLRLYRENDTASVVTYSDANGNFTFPILDGVQYTIKGIKSGYLTKSTTVTPDCQSVLDMVKMGMVLNRDTPNKPIILENIYYDLDKYDIRPDAALELDKLVQTLNDNPRIKIELSSHTDSRQTHSYNNLLSQLRAESAVKYIVSKGISRLRLTAKGYGETRLLNRCTDNAKCTEEEHQLNRRTEFKILSK